MTIKLSYFWVSSILIQVWSYRLRRFQRLPIGINFVWPESMTPFLWKRANRTWSRISKGSSFNIGTKQQNVRSGSKSRPRTMSDFIRLLLVSILRAFGNIYRREGALKLFGSRVSKTNSSWFGAGAG